MCRLRRSIRLAGEKTFGAFFEKSGFFQSHSSKPEGRVKPRRGQWPRVLHGVAVPFPSSHITRSGRLRLTANRPYDFSHRHALLCIATTGTTLTSKSATANGRNDPLDKLTRAHNFCTDETISRIIVAPTKQSVGANKTKRQAAVGICPSDLLAAVCYHSCKRR